MEYPSDWKNVDNFLVRTFTFNNFLEAVEFVTKIAPIAEEMNHHPDIEIFTYKNVRVKTTTHDTGKIGEKDIKLAEKINSIL